MPEAKTVRDDRGHPLRRPVPGFCWSAPLDEVRKHGHVLTPGRHVGAEAQEIDGEPFKDKMRRLDTANAANLEALAAGLHNSA